MWSAVKEAFRKYAVFSGRSGRCALEGFFLFQISVSGVLLALLALIALGVELNKGAGITHWSNLALAITALVLLVLSLLYGLAMILPSIALITRRLHDTNRSGRWFLAWFILKFLTFIGFTATIITLTLMQQKEAASEARLLSWIFNPLLMIPEYLFLYWLAQPSIGDNRFGPALVELEPDGPVDGLLPQASGFWAGVRHAWIQNWRNFGIRGRLSRSEYWCFQFSITFASIPFWILMIVFFPTLPTNEGGGYLLVFGFSAGASAILLWLSTVTGIRRLHDVDCCGWWYLIFLVPPLGALAWQYLIFKPSTSGDNRFGPQPQPML